LQAINHQSNIPRSIVNRVVTSRDDQLRVNFVKYGVVMRHTAQPNTINESIPSSHHSRRKNNTSFGQSVAPQEALKKELNKIYDEIDDDGERKGTPSPVPINVEIQERKVGKTQGGVLSSPKIRSSLQDAAKLSANHLTEAGQPIHIQDSHQEKNEDESQSEYTPYESIEPADDRSASVANQLFSGVNGNVFLKDESATNSYVADF